MQCSRCKHEFCWLCLGSFFAYRHDKTGIFCSFRYAAVYGVIIALLIMLTAKVGYAWKLIGNYLFPFLTKASFCLIIDLHGILFCVIGSLFW